MRKILWGRVFGAVFCLAAVVGGSVFAYSKYTENDLEIKKLQQIYDGSVLGEEKSVDDSKAKEIIPPFPLSPEVLQANKDKIKSGDFTGVKAVVFRSKQAPGQLSHIDKSESSLYDIAYWGSGQGFENDDFVRVKLADSDKTKLDLLGTQHVGQQVGYEIEFIDNDGHFAVHRLILCPSQQQDKKPQP